MSDSSVEPRSSSLVGYEYSTEEKLRLFFPSLRQKLLPKRNLLAGPFGGEFGWELMQWQGFVRTRRRCYNETHVLTYPGRDYLYEECRVHYHKIDLKTAGYGYGLLGPAAAHAMATTKAREIGLTNYDLFSPPLLCTRHHRALWKQEFRLFREAPITEEPYDVLLHFRAMRKEGPDQAKNYSPELADALVRLCHERGLRVGCIGHPAYSYCPEFCHDHRSTELRHTVAAISSARLISGENSGPMHLANLCGKPTVIWAQDQWRIDYSLRWNPFRVPIYVATNATSQPDPALVCQTIGHALQELRVSSEGFTRPLFTGPAQPIAPY